MSRAFVFRKKRLKPSGLFQFGLKGSVAGANFLLPVIQLLIAVSLLFGVAFWIAMMLCYSKTIQTLLCCGLVSNSSFRMGPSQCELLSMTKSRGLTASAWELGIARGCDMTWHSLHAKWVTSGMCGYCPVLLTPVQCCELFLRGQEVPPPWWREGLKCGLRFAVQPILLNQFLSDEGG